MASVIHKTTHFIIKGRNKPNGEVYLRPIKIIVLTTANR
jgi:hypothetical protein